MTDLPVPPPAEAPRQPHIIEAEWSKSKAEIYNPDEIFAQAQAEAITVFDKSDFGSAIERARLSLEPAQTEDGELCIGISAQIQLDRSTANFETIIKRFKDRFYPNTRTIGDGMIVDKTQFDNCFAVTDSKNGVKMLVAILPDGSIQISNHGGWETNANGEVKKSVVYAPAVHTTDPESQMRGASRILMRTLDVANTTPTTSTSNPLNRRYAIGERVTGVAYTTIISKALGRSSIQGVKSETPPTSSPENPSPSNSSIEQDLGITIDRESDKEIRLEDIGGLSGVKEKLRDIAISFTHPEIMKKWGAKRPQGLILYGEPGTGKTMLATALANEIEADLWKIQGSDIYNMWLGNSEAKIKEIFDKARKLKVRTVILFDEFDSIIGTSEEPGPGSGGAARNGVAGIFKQEMNDLAKENPNVLMVATTNKLDRIDPALIRPGRFDHKIYVPMPDDEARSDIILGIIADGILSQEESDFRLYADGINLAQLTRLTDDMSGADIAEIFRRIHLKKAMQEARSGVAEPITQDELEEVIRDYRTQG